MEKLEEFIKKANACHQGQNLDYSKAVYINNRTPLCIIDPEYGEFWQTPSNHLKGQSHPKRKGNSIRNKKSSTQEEIIKRFEEVHKGEGLDYSKVKYVNMHTKVCIIDPVYGEYWQEPVVHLKGCKCPLIKPQPKKLSQEEFIAKAKAIHGDTYDYSKTVYKTYRDKVIITCKKHGDFEQTAENHLYGKGCPKCGNHYSKYEDEIANLLGKNVIHNEKNILDGKEIDLYYPDDKIGIEFNGLKWHTENFAGKDRNYHLNKTVECENKGIKLIQIFEDEYVLHKDVVKSKLKHIFNLDSDKPRIYARNCNVYEIDNKTANTFLDRFHIQGGSKSTVYLGAYEIYNTKKLLAVMSFRKYGPDKWELTRFASDYNLVFVGIGGKMFKYFVKNYNPVEVKSFADRRWTINQENLYTKIGFEFDGYVPPNYTYYNEKVARLKRFHKFGFRKKILSKKHNLQLSMTELEMTKQLGYDRIWDCGLIRYVWHKKQKTPTE